MKTQRYGSDLNIKIRLAAYELNMPPLSAKASIYDKEAFLSLTSKALMMQRTLKEISHQIDTSSGSPTFTVKDHDRIVAVIEA